MLQNGHRFPFVHKNLLRTNESIKCFSECSLFRVKEIEMRGCWDLVLKQWTIKKKCSLWRFYCVRLCMVQVFSYKTHTWCFLFLLIWQPFEIFYSIGFVCTVHKIKKRALHFSCHLIIRKRHDIIQNIRHAIIFLF